MRSGEYYHVIGRGNIRQWIIEDDEDFEYYVEQLRKYQQKFAVSLFHYCIMSNHVHLLLRSEEADDAITRMMKGVHMVYAKHFKRKHETTGHVFEDRFKSWHVNSDAYLLECGRYIERNPVRAKMVEEPAQ